MEKISSVEEYIEKQDQWSEALNLLRDVMNSTELVETIKWSIPAYTINGKNVLGLGAFKNHVGVWFFNGVFLKDEHNLLRNAQEGKTKAMRQLNYDSIDAIDKNILKAYVLEAIENQKAGKEIKADRSKKEVILPEELKSVFKTDSELKQSFERLTPGKQREYCDHIASAKQEATRLRRLDKAIPLILSGVGLHDKYKNC